MATRATTGTVAHTWRIRNFGSVREIFSTGKLYSDTFWCPPLLPDKQQPRSRTVSVGDSHHRGHSDAPSSSSLVPMSWVIIIYPNGNNRKDHCSCYLRVVPTLEEKQRVGWKRDYMNFTMQMQVVQKKTKFGAPETMDLVTWTSDNCSFDAENPDWGNHKLLEHSKLPPIETDHDLFITIYITFHIVEPHLPKHFYSNYNLKPILAMSPASSSPSSSVADPDSDSFDEDDSAVQFVFPPLDLTAQLADPRFVDITFRFPGDPRLLHAHRVILTPRAPGLLDHLSPSGEWATSLEPIVVMNAPYDIFFSILHYVYSSRFPPAETADARLNDVQFLIATYEVAQTYKMDELMTRCAKQVAELADDEFKLTKYWAQLFRFGFVIKERAVRDKVLPWVINHWDEVKGSEALKLLTAEENLMVWLKDTFQEIEGRSTTE
ncbi:hypothetical protein BC937DRAFT_89599 [Endogone sp. FLAS-F59071]|nr:hypothetical protein BC937DRAFT_89599 [Endogone sp. FLAS-F59071]|eukprot:RUS17699.1 hypothetical protein BC937DRAFT_89599 [Endogone sp. FLAS-F59071]